MKEQSRLRGIIIVCHVMIVVFLSLLLIVSPAICIIVGGVIVLYLLVNLINDTIRER